MEGKPQTTSASLLRDRRFWPFFWVQFLGALNDNVLKNALVILITFRSLTLFGVPPAQMVALAGGIFILPFFLFSPLAGELADKYEKSKIIRMLKITEALIMLVTAWGLMAGYHEMVLVMLFFMGMQSAFFGPVKYSILPQLLLKEELVAATAMVELGTFSAILLGTITGGVLIAMGESGPALVSVVLVGLALLGFLSSIFINRVTPHAPGLRLSREPFTPIVSSIRFMLRDRTVFFSIVGISWFWFYGAALLSLLPTYVKQVLMGNEAVVTLFLALFTLGIGAGSILCEKASGEKLETGMVTPGAMGLTLFAADIWLTGNPYPSGDLLTLGDYFSRLSGIRVMADFLLLSVAGGFFIVPLYTLIQVRTGDENRSRIIAGNNIMNALFMVGAALAVAAFLKAGITLPGIFGIMALVNLAVCAGVFLVMPEMPKRFLAFFRRKGSG